MAWKKVLYAFVVLVVAGLAGLSGALAGGLAVYSALSQGQAAAPPAATAYSPVPTLVDQNIQVASTQVETAVTAAVERVGPAVVTVVGTLPGQETFFGRTADQTVSGSGVIISAENYIVTNNHVVEGVKQVAILLADGSQLPAEVIGTDIFADLAVLKAAGELPAVATLGNSDNLKPGETVIAIGSPLGDFVNTVTVGVVSATGRVLDTGEGYQMEDLIQTDAAINQGNSGGPLVNLAGEVIAINTLVVRGSGYGGTIAEGLGFAIPVNTVRAVAEQIIANGYFARPDLGIRWQPISPRLARAYDLPVEWGVYVTRVAAGGPAARAGLQVGDIITRIGETTLDEDHSFINALFAHAPGEQVTIGLVRAGKSLELKAVLGELRQ